VIDTILVIVYFVVIFVIGVLMYRRSRNYDDYLVAGRKFNAFFIAMTIAAGISSATVGVAGLGYSFGMVGAWFFIMLALGAWILLFTVAGRLRALAQYSLIDVFNMRYDARARVTLSILGTIAYVILLSIGFVGGGQVLKSLFNIPLFPAMLIMAVPFITYTALGGLWASAVTNIIKFSILCVGLVILVSFAISRAGGWAHLTATLPPGSFNLFSAGAWPFVWAFFWVMTLSMWVAADIYQLVFSAKDARAAKVGLSFAGVIIALVGLAAAFIGMGASVIFPKIDPEAAMPTLAATLAPGLRGLVAIAMLSGSAIAVVIFQIVAATQLVRGIWPQKQMSMNKVRWISALMGMLGLLFAWLDPNVVSLTELTFRIFIPATFIPNPGRFLLEKGDRGRRAAFLLGRSGGIGNVAPPSAADADCASGLMVRAGLHRSCRIVCRAGRGEFPFQAIPCRKVAAVHASALADVTACMWATNLDRKHEVFYQ
jgi:SSS family solute:Na+ symporter